MIKRFVRKGAFIVLVLAFLSGGAASADAAIDKEGGKRLQTVFEDILSQYDEIAKSNGATLVRQGSLMVEAGETYYAVTLPDLSVKHADGSRTAIGMISVNAAPGEKPGQWKMTMALPMPLIHYDSANAPVLTVKTGTQNCGGIWDETEKNFIKLNARYQNVSIRQNKDMATIDVPDMRLTMEMTEKNAPGLWTGPGVLTLSGLRVFSEHSGSTLGIGEMKIVSLVTDYSFKAMRDYQEKLTALAESYENGDETTVSSAHVGALYNLLVDFMGTAWEGYDFGIFVKDFAFKAPARKGQPGADIRLGGGQFGFGMSGFRAGLVGMGLSFGYNGLGFTMENPLYKGTIPDHANVDFRVDKLPYKELVDLGRTSIQGLADAPQAGALVGMNAVMMLPQLLTKAQTTMTLKDSVIGNERYDIASNATMTANMNAVSGMTGTATTQIYGLDYLIDTLSSIAANPETPEENKAGVQQALASLTVLKMAGQMAKDDKGRDTRSYLLELNEKGQTLLNGTDLQTLMSTMQGAKK